MTAFPGMFYILMLSVHRSVCAGKWNVRFSMRLTVTDCGPPDPLTEYRQPLGPLLPNRSDYLSLFPSPATFHYSQPIATVVVQQAMRRVYLRQLRARLGLERRLGSEQLLNVSNQQCGVV